MANAINNSTDLNTTNGIQNSLLGNTTTKKNDELGKDEFLQLLIAQMQYQDPLDPQDNGEYIAQLAQFSALEQMSNVAKGMDTLGTLMDNMNTSVLVGQLSGFIGQDIRWTTVDEDGVKTVHTGKVTAVKIVDGQPSIVAQDSTADNKVVVVTIPQINGIGDLKDLAQGLDKPKEDETTTK